MILSPQFNFCLHFVLLSKPLDTKNKTAKLQHFDFTSTSGSRLNKSSLVSKVLRAFQTSQQGPDENS
jgi:hypothetical protein